MALPQSAVSELLEAFRAGDGVDLVRESGTCQPCWVSLLVVRLSLLVRVG